MAGWQPASGSVTSPGDDLRFGHSPVFIGGGQGGAAAPAGLALAFADGVFRITITDAAGRPLGTLGPFAEDEVVAVWRRVAAASGLPLLVAGPDGSLEPAYPQVGRLRLGAERDTRRLAVLSGRRPRFLVRRKASRLPRRPLVHQESEIAAGRGS